MTTPAGSEPENAVVLGYEAAPMAKTRGRAPNQKQNLFLAILTAVTWAMSGVMVQQGKASWLEAASVGLGAVCVWLTVRESVWNFPLGLVNVATFAVVFYKAKLYADASLQVVFFALSAVGWYFWLRGGVQHTEAPIQKAIGNERVHTVVGVLLVWGGYWYLTHNLGGSAPAFDALTTALSIGAQWLLTRKRIENWILWIIADVIYIPLYWYKDLRLTAGLYAVFLCMAVMGLLHWRRLFREQNVDGPVGGWR